MKIRLCVVSHSLVADRQAIFWNYFGTLPDVELLQIYPARWGDLERKGGFSSTQDGIYHYIYGPGAFEAFRDFKPEIVYVQQEKDSDVAHQVLSWGSRLTPRPRMGLFVWNNIKPPVSNLPYDFIIAGNLEARKLHNADIVVPQVGIDFDLFHIERSNRGFDLVFASRKVPEKGWDIIPKLGFSIVSTGGEDYAKMQDFYNSAKVHILLSQDTPQWKEQFLPYSNVEALACGCRCVIGETRATLEWGLGTPGVKFVPPKREKWDTYYVPTVRQRVEEALLNWQENVEGRDWAKRRFSKEVVGEQLYRFFSGVA